MRSAYPLLVDQNGWSAGICRIPNTAAASTTTTSLLRSVGVDLTRPSQLHHQAHHDIEIHVEDPPSTFSHEYPQPLPVAATHGTIERGKGKGAGGADHRSKRKLPNSDASTRGNTFNRAVQRLELSIRPDGELCFDTREPPLSATPSRGSGASAGTPRASPRSSSSPRTAYNRQHESVHSGVAPAIDPSGGAPQQNHNQGHRTRGSNGTGSCGRMGPAPSFTLPMMSRPSQLSLCCSSPDYYYNEERLRQEPEPGLLKCCDTKISCCPCSPCCEPYCPVGHMNTVCMSMICSGIIMFIVLSPLLHYLVPT